MVEDAHKQGVPTVTVATFENQPDAHIAQGRLAAEGIPSALADEHLVQADWLYAIAVGWIKLQVAPEDVTRALRVLGTDFSAELDAGGE
ncbi:MAG: DUF2007 domain-containing protein [Gammaproteobacteria bacterium]|nr:DUF2007 domain-containing protein [Gammaproteobacteria bacterium]